MTTFGRSRLIGASAKEEKDVNRAGLTDVFICDGIRTPIGRYGGALSAVRADDLAAIPIRALIERHPRLDWAAVDDI